MNPGICIPMGGTDSAIGMKELYGRKLRSPEPASTETQMASEWEETSRGLCRVSSPLSAPLPGFRRAIQCHSLYSSTRVQNLALLGLPQSSHIDLKCPWYLCCPPLAWSLLSWAHSGPDHLPPLRQPFTSKTFLRAHTSSFCPLTHPCSSLLSRP